MSFGKEYKTSFGRLLKNEEKRDVLGIFYTAVVCMLPFFASYASGIPGFTVADILLVICVLLCLAFKRKITEDKSFTVTIVPFIFGLFLIALFSIFASFYRDFLYYDVSIRLIRYFFYIFCVFYISPRLLLCNLFNHLIILFSTISTVYILIQYVAYKIFDKVLLGFIPFFELYVPEYAEADYETFYLTMYRPTSFFLEPAHYARYIILAIILVLFAETKYKNRGVISLFLTVGILISTSTQGYAILLTVWAVHFLDVIYKKMNALEFAMRATGTILIVYFFLNTQFVKDTIERTFNGSLYDGNTAVGARLGGIFQFFELDLVQQFTGKGFGTVPPKEWFSSAIYWLYGSGIIVFTVFILFMLYYLIVLKGYKKVISLVFLLLFFVDDSFQGYMCVIFWSSILIDEKGKEEKYLPGQEQRIKIQGHI